MPKTLNKFLKESGYLTIKLQFLKSQHYSLEAKINGVNGKFILDTGASNSCICASLENNFKIISIETIEKASSATSEISNTKISKNKINLITLQMSHINDVLSEKKINSVSGIIRGDI